MSTADQDWKEFNKWTKFQVIKSRGFRRGLDRTLDATVLQQWNDVVDKQAYLRCIRQHEQRESQVARARNENDPNVGVHRRFVRRARARAIAVSLKSYSDNLQRLQRIQKSGGKSGQAVTFATIIRHFDRLLRDAKNEIRSSGQVAVREAVEEMCAAFPTMPDDAKDYVALTYQELPWEEISENDVTDREMTVQLRSDLLASQDYKDLETLDWSEMSLSTQILRSARKRGQVRCDGHNLVQQEEDAEPFARNFMSNEWRGYILYFGNIRTRDRPVPRWVVQAAKTRAEMLWDHTGTAVYPPEPDHSDLDFTLDKITKAEDQYYQDRQTKLWHVKIEYAVAEHLNERQNRPVRLPSSASTSRPLNNETVQMLETGRRALSHTWESELWQIIQIQRRPAAEIRATYGLYKKALRLFDENPLVTKRDRRWMSPEYTDSLKGIQTLRPT